MTSRRVALIVAVVAAAAVLVAMMSRPLPPVVTVTDAPMREATVVSVADRGPGLHGAMGQAAFWQEPRQTGPSQDRLDFVFDDDAEVVGVLVSVDAWPELSLVEFAAGVNVGGYGITDHDWLIHASSTSGGDIDQQVWFPEPMLLEVGDRISVVAWLQNTEADRHFVSPEVIVYYRSSNRM